MGDSWVVEGHGIRSDDVFLDPTIGRRTEFSVQWTQPTTGKDYPHNK